MARVEYQDSPFAPSVGQMTSEAAGWRANLALSFERRATGTILVHNRHEGPLMVQKPLYPEGRGTCHVAVLHPPGGIASGDRLHICADLRAGARALLTTPGATKWYRSEGAVARQDIRFSVGGDAILEWLPREGILFDGARVATSLEVTLAPSAGYVGWDILSFGRRASGERFNRGHLWMRTAIRRGDNLLWSETADLDASSRFAQSSVGLSGFTVCGTLAIVGYEIDNDTIAACRAVSTDTGVVGVGAAGAGRAAVCATGVGGAALGTARVGITRLPQVLIARYLGHSTEMAFDWFTRLWALLRPTLSNRLACAPRVWAC